MFVGPIKLFWGQNDPYARASGTRHAPQEDTISRREVQEQNDLADKQADNSRLARAAEISLRQIDKMSPLLEPVE